MKVFGVNESLINAKDKLYADLDRVKGSSSEIVSGLINVNQQKINSLDDSIVNKTYPASQSSYVTANKIILGKRLEEVVEDYIQPAGGIIKNLLAVADAHDNKELRQVTQDYRKSVTQAGYEIAGLRDYFSSPAEGMNR